MKASTSTVAVNAVPPAAAGPVRSSRIAPHSHIKGLGVTPEGYVAGDAAGFVGQESAREVWDFHTRDAVPLTCFV